VSLHAASVLQNPPAWANKQPGETLFVHSEQYQDGSSLLWREGGLTVAYSKSHVSDLQTGPEVLLPASNQT